MIKKIAKKTGMYILILLVAYLGVGYLFHLVIFPEKKPEVSTYFQKGHEFYSKAEKVRQFVKKQENGIVYCASVVEPFAGGPPKHIHTDFDETFEVQNGELSLWVDGKVKKIRPGEKLFIARGTPHKPYNETGDTIYVKGTVPFPEKFAYHLLQVYGLMDADPSFGKSPKTALQMALFHASGFDSYVADGPPVAIQKFMSFLLAPATRLCGYKSYYAEYDINNKSIVKR